MKIEENTSLNYTIRRGSRGENCLKYYTDSKELY